MRFKFKEPKHGEPKPGPHTIGSTRYACGDIIETDSDLEKLFPLKFERIDKPVRSAKGATRKVVPQPAPIPLPFGDLGENVTSKCENAPVGYAVFNDRVIKYTVVDVANNLIAKLGLRNLSEVNEYLASLRPRTDKPSMAPEIEVVTDDDGDLTEVEIVDDADVEV